VTTGHHWCVSTDALPISCAAVSKRFGAVPALDRLDLQVAAGQVVGYLGPNGSGKSTTIRILLDLARADRGTVRVFGQDPRRAGARLRARIGYLPGELRLDDRLRVDDTLDMWARVRDMPTDRAYVAQLCERLDLDPTRQTAGLSSGNRRKVGLVGAFMSRPDLLILDEPTAGVDPLVQAEFVDLVRAARNRGGTVLLSSHVLAEVQRVADSVVIIRAGRAVASGTMEELSRTAVQPFSIRFVGDAPADELALIPGVRDLNIDAHHVVGAFIGSPDRLLAVLARHPIEHMTMPEPDLEQSFLHFYDEDAT
jgi:ABC-2 type transport system ATP-binding protein